MWFKAVVSYPSNYLNHISRYFQAMWFQDPGWIFNSSSIQQAPSHPWHIQTASHFRENERKVTLSPLRKNIYDFLYDKKILFNHVVGVYLGFALLFVTGLLWIFSQTLRSKLLLFSFSTSLSACCTAIVVCIFSPAPDPRYMSPVLVLSLISLLSFSSFSLLKITNRNLDSLTLQ